MVLRTCDVPAAIPAGIMEAPVSAFLRLAVGCGVRCAVQDATSMRVRVLFFGVLKDVAGKAVDELSLPDGATLADLVLHYETAIPKLRAWSPSLALALN